MGELVSPLWPTHLLPRPLLLTLAQPVHKKGRVLSLLSTLLGKPSVPTGHQALAPGTQGSDTQDTLCFSAGRRAPPWLAGGFVLWRLALCPAPLPAGRLGRQQLARAGRPSGGLCGGQPPRAPLLAPGHLVPLSPFVWLQGEAERQRGRRQGRLGLLSSELRKEELERAE